MPRTHGVKERGGSRRRRRSRFRHPRAAGGALSPCRTVPMIAERTDPACPVERSRVPSAGSGSRSVRLTRAGRASSPGRSPPLLGRPTTLRGRPWVRGRCWSPQHLPEGSGGVVVGHRVRCRGVDRTVQLGTGQRVVVDPTISSMLISSPTGRLTRACAKPQLERRKLQPQGTSARVLHDAGAHVHHAGRTDERARLLFPGPARARSGTHSRMRVLGEGAVTAVGVVGVDARGAHQNARTIVRPGSFRASNYVPGTRLSWMRRLTLLVQRVAGGSRPGRLPRRRRPAISTSERAPERASSGRDSLVVRLTLASCCCLNGDRQHRNVRTASPRPPRGARRLPGEELGSTGTHLTSSGTSELSDRPRRDHLCRSWGRCSASSMCSCSCLVSVLIGQIERWTAMRELAASCWPVLRS